jgi:hypothetical protein
MPGHIGRAAGEQQAPWRAREVQRRRQDHRADGIEVPLAALGAVQGLDAVAQLGVPAALGGPLALEAVRARLLAAEVVAEAVALADQRAVARPRHVAQLPIGLRALGAFLLEGPDCRVGARHGASPPDQGKDPEGDGEEDQDRGVPFADVDGHARDERREDIDGDGRRRDGYADPARPAGGCRCARLHEGGDTRPGPPG